MWSKGLPWYSVGAAWSLVCPLTCVTATTSKGPGGRCFVLLTISVLWNLAASLFYPSLFFGDRSYLAQLPTCVWVISERMGSGCQVSVCRGPRQAANDSAALISQEGQKHFPLVLTG